MIKFNDVPSRVGFSGVPIWCALVCALALSAPSIGCGGGSKRSVKGSKRIAKPKLPPVKPAALREFDAGIRAMRLGGPESSEIAKERFVKAVQLDGKLWEAWHNLGILHYRMGRDSAAAEAFGNALRINPAHVEAMTARAEAYRRAGKFGKARKDYRRALDQRKNKGAGVRLASLLRQMKKYEDAIDALRDVLRNHGTSAKLYVELGLIYIAQGRDELAKLVLQKATKLNAKEASAYNALALLALEKGDAQEAFNQFDYATSLDPNYLDARFNKASVLLDAGDFSRAKDELDAILLKNRNDAAALLSLGVALRGLKKYNEAESTWEKVVKRARSGRLRGDALYNLFILQLDFKEKEKDAAKALDRYLQNSPSNHPKRKQALEKKKQLGS